MPTFPTAETLRRFFRTDPRKRVPLAVLAELLGTTTAEVRAMLRAENRSRPGRTLPWSEAAAYLLDAWPRAEILDALGPGFDDVIPEQFRLTHVTWSIPIFLVRAMEHQAGETRVEDYVADLLYNAITPETVEALGREGGWGRAWGWPGGVGGATSSC